MRERKNVGEYVTEVVPPTPLGRKAVAVMQVEILVEVNETDDWNDMVEQAKESLRKRVIEGKGFFPYKSKCELIHTDVEVDELKYHILVEKRSQW